MNRTRATILSVTGGEQTADCEEVEAKELYVQRAYACDDGTRVLTFADVAARDAYLTTAEAFGQVTVERSSDGAAWARVR
jgi:hypothetical protein